MLVCFHWGTSGSFSFRPISFFLNSPNFSFLFLTFASVACFAGSGPDSFTALHHCSLLRCSPCQVLTIPRTTGPLGQQSAGMSDTCKLEAQSLVETSCLAAGWTFQHRYIRRDV